MDTFSSLLKIYNYAGSVVDIGVLSFLLYKAYEIITRTNAMQLIKAAVLVAMAYVVAYLLRLQTLLWVFNIMAPRVI